MSTVIWSSGAWVRIPLSSHIFATMNTQDQVVSLLARFTLLFSP